MATRYLLDTDRIIDALNGIPEAAATINELEATGVTVSLISYAELYEGAYYGRDRNAALATLTTFIRNKPLLPVTQEILERFAVIRGSLSRHLRQQIGDMDLIIAATALTYNLTLVTRDLRDFQHIPDLDIYAMSQS